MGAPWAPYAPYIVGIYWVYIPLSFWLRNLTQDATKTTKNITIRFGIPSWPSLSTDTTTGGVVSTTGIAYSQSHTSHLQSETIQEGLVFTDQYKDLNSSELSKTFQQAPMIKLIFSIDSWGATATTPKRRTTASPTATHATTATLQLSLQLQMQLQIYYDYYYSTTVLQ